jgi:hypothetical protein
MMPGKRRNQKQNPKILITEYTDAKDYAKRYSREVARLRAEGKLPKPVLSAEEQEQKAEAKRQKARDYFKRLRADAETRRTLNRREWEYKKTNPRFLIKARLRKQFSRNTHRQAVLAHYGVNGEPVCRRCGFDEDVRAMAIDHINDGGSAHRRERRGGKLHAWLIQNEFPEGFQTLCFNCNAIKEYDRVAERMAAKAESDLALIS